MNVPTIQLQNPITQVGIQIIATNLGFLGNEQIVSTTTTGEIANKIVSLGELEQANSGTNEIRVPLGRNSMIDLVNGGVKLPDGLEQQFFVVTNSATEEN